MQGRKRTGISRISPIRWHLISLATLSIRPVLSPIRVDERALRMERVSHRPAGPLPIDNTPLFAFYPFLETPSPSLSRRFPRGAFQIPVTSLHFFLTRNDPPPVPAMIYPLLPNFGQFIAFRLAIIIANYIPKKKDSCYFTFFSQRSPKRVICHSIDSIYCVNFYMLDLFNAALRFKYVTFFSSYCNVGPTLAKLCAVRCSQNKLILHQKLAFEL